MVDKKERNNFIVEMKIKEDGGCFTPIVDRFVGSANDARDLLNLKYCSKRASLFDRMGMAVEIASDQFEKILDEEED